MKLGFLILSMLFCLPMAAQDPAILKTILSHYYQNEKVIVKNRNQLLFFFCDKPNNSEELFETVNALKLKPETVAAIRRQIATDVAPENWAADYDRALPPEHPLRAKINDCQSLDAYQEKQRRFNLNNQRMLIVHKPVFFEKTRALVKIVFYRTIEHNSGSVLLMEKQGENWVIREKLNNWST